MRGGVADEDVRAIPSGVHDEEGRISIAEVIIVLALCWRVKVCVGIVDLKGIRGVRERSLGIISLPDVVVDNLPIGQ